MNPQHIFLMTFFKGTAQINLAVFLFKRGVILGQLYEQYLTEAKAMCEEEGIHYIPLDHFTDRERKNPGSGIPEPTPYGAISLAKLIQEGMFKQMEIEEGQ